MKVIKHSLFLALSDDVWVDRRSPPDPGRAAGHRQQRCGEGPTDQHDLLRVGNLHPAANRDRQQVGVDVIDMEFNEWLHSFPAKKLAVMNYCNLNGLCHGLKTS